MLKKPALNVEFPEDVKGLLESNDLQRVLTGHVDGTVAETLSQEPPAHLVDRVNQGPVDDLEDKGEPEQQPTQQS